MLDVRTIAATFFITSVVITIVLLVLWRQSRKQFDGTHLWLAGVILQTVGFLLVALRNVIPDFASILIANICLAVAPFTIYLGFERFVANRGPQLHNYIILAIFVGFFSYFTFSQPNVSIRIALISIVIMLMMSQSSWLLLHRVGSQLKPITRVTGIMCLIYVLAQGYRLIIVFLLPNSTDYLNTSIYDASLQIINLVLAIGLVFALVLMVNRRILLNLLNQDEMLIRSKVEMEINKREMTELKRTEEALRESEEKYRNLVENTVEGICVLQDGLLKFVNHALAVIAGSSVDEMTERSFLEYVYPEDQNLIIERESRRISGEQFEAAYAFRAVDKEKRTKWLRLNSVLITWEGKPATLNFLEDITEQERMKDVARASEELYRLLADHTTDYVWLMDMNLKNIYVSPSVIKRTGFTEQEMRELPLERHITAESLKVATEVFLEYIPKLTADPKYNPTSTFDIEYCCKNGTTFWTENKFSLIWDNNGKPVSILGEARDISQYRKTQKALQQSQEWHRSILQTAMDGFWMTDLQGHLLEVNEAYCRMSGYSAQELMSMSVADLEMAADIGVHIEKVMEKGTDHFESKHRRKDGGIFDVDINIQRHIYDSNLMVGFLRDISERKRTEEHLVKSYEALKKTLDDAINAMVKIVELRDPYTAGHQHKVASLATVIAREMKLDDTRIDQLRTAAVIHDIGKMYVPSDILSKPGKLSDMELNLIKTHCQSGYDIVKSMDFPVNVAKTVLQHHERLDGSGYPNKLIGEDTLLEAKILAVADVVEAMASHRPYRAALGIDKGLDEISHGRGKLYDPDVVDTCLKVFEEGFLFDCQDK